MIIEMAAGAMAAQGLIDTIYAAVRLFVRG